jgi:Fe-S oxidoreductase
MGLAEYREEMLTCQRCSACKFIPLELVKGYRRVEICPSIKRFNFHAYSGGGRMAIGMALLEGRISYSQSLLEVLYNCQMCGGCDVSCKYAMDMEVLEPMREMRIEAVEKGATIPVFEAMIKNLREEGRMVRSSLAWQDGLSTKDYDRDGAPTVFHVGCRIRAEESLLGVARSSLMLLEKAGVDVRIGRNLEMCCGGRAYDLGYRREFLDHARRYVRRLREAGAKRLVTACAECYFTFKVLYEKFGIRDDMEVLHMSELLLTLLREGKIKTGRRLRMRVTYHDPCHLGRLGEPYIPYEGRRLPGHLILFDPPKTFRRGTHGVYEPPREVLKAIEGVEVFEMERRKEYAWCCGAGGGVAEFNPSSALFTAKERLEEARDTGADGVVTACPGCKANLSKAKEDQDLQILDIAELLARASL